MSRDNSRGEESCPWGFRDAAFLSCHPGWVGFSEMQMFSLTHVPPHPHTRSWKDSHTLVFLQLHHTWVKSVIVIVIIVVAIVIVIVIFSSLSGANGHPFVSPQEKLPYTQGLPILLQVAAQVSEGLVTLGPLCRKEEHWTGKTWFSLHPTLGNIFCLRAGSGNPPASLLAFELQAQRTSWDSIISCDVP